MSDREGAWRRFATDYRQILVSPEAKQRLLDRISEIPPPRRGWTLALGWFEPSVSPLWTAAAIVVAFFLGATFMRVALVPRPNDARPPVSTGAPAETLVPVRFTLIAPGARYVSVAGDFNRWDPASLAMTRVSPEGLWTVTVDLPRGRHSFSFVIDGRRWVPDPKALLGPDDGFGSRSSVVVVRDPKAT